MNDQEVEDKQLQDKLKQINTIEVQNFISEFHNSNTSNKTFSFIEENFIKKYRFKNSLPQKQNDPHSTITQFINGFKQTVKFYESYHQYIESSLEKFSFTKDFKRFMSHLYKSQKKTMNFFLTQLEFHRAFMAQNEARYNKKIQSMNEVCSNCKQNMVRKSFESIKRQIGYNFNDPYKLFKRADSTRYNDLNNQLNFKNSYGFERIEQLQQANGKMRNLLKESKKIDFSKMDEIYDHFDKKQEIQIQPLEKGKVNEMFYDLQTQLDNQSSQLGQYLDQLIMLNDKLINYHPSTDLKILQLKQKNETQPKDVQNQLKYNFSKLIRKIYKKITELIQKRKQQAVSQQTQVNFSQDSIIKELQKHKSRLQLQLKQSKQQKKFFISTLKQENDILKKQIKRLTEENNKIDILNQQTQLQKNNIQRKQEKLIKVINQLKKQIQRLTIIVDRKDFLNSKKQFITTQNKLGTQLNLQNISENQIQQKQQNDALNLKSSQRISKKHLIGLPNIQHQTKEAIPIITKSPQQQLLQEMQRHQLELINSLAKKKLKNNKKKYLQPRRSKLAETITIEETDLQKQVSRFSQIKSEQLELVNQLTKQKQSQNQFQPEKSESEDDISSQQQAQVFRMIKEPTIKEIIQKNEQQEESESSQKSQKEVVKKNHKSKTFAKIKQQFDIKTNQRGKSSRSISQNEQDIQQRLNQLRKLKSMKELEIKLENLTNKLPNALFKKVNFHQNPSNVFKIHKQVQYTISGLKPNKSLEKGSSLSKNQTQSRGTHHQSLYKDDLLKRFGRSSVNFHNSSKLQKSNLSHLQLPSASHNLKLPNQQQRKSSISISSKNFLSLCEEISKNNQDGKFNIGTQTLWSHHQILKMLYQFQLQSRKWNEILVPFNCFKFGYQQFMNQLCQLIQKQEKNPIRKLNGYKGSSDVLKKSHNYRFNKENLSFINSKGQHQDQVSNLSEEEIKIKKNLQKNSDEKQYFVPRYSNQSNKSLKQEKRMNQTTTQGFLRHQKSECEDIEQNEIPQKAIQSSISLAQLKTPMKNIKTFDPSVLFIANNNKNFRKKGVYNFNHIKTDGNCRQNKHEVDEQEKLPIINENLETLKIPNFSKQDAQNLFFSIESARTVQENLKNNKSKSQLPFFTLEKYQIRFTTQILTMLAQIHLIQPQSYNEIRNILIFPAKVLTNKNKSLGSENKQQIEKDQKQSSETQLSLKNGLSYAIQLHRKCVKCNSLGKHKSSSKDNLKILQNSFKTKIVCEHLVAFRRKVGDVIKLHQVLKKKVTSVENEF